MRRALLIPVLLALAAGGSRAQEPADLVIRNARVLTMTDGERTHGVVALRGDRILYVGDDPGAVAIDAGRTRVIDADGCTVTPGLVDSHGHLSNLGRILTEPNLVGSRSIEEVLSRVREYQRGLADDEWLHGRGWDQNDWSTKEFPTWRDLESTNRNPVYLERVDGHALWVNRRALERAGITRDTRDPPGGRIVRDEHGEPTGVFVDNAEELIEAHATAPSAELVDRWIAAAVAECNRVGLTGVHDAGTTRPVLEALRRLAHSGRLTLNVYCMIDSDDATLAREFLAAGPSREAGGRLVMRCLKLRADGALGSRGAALLAPYSDDPGNTGLDVQTPDVLLAWTRDALRSGFQVGTHAIGDRGNRVTLDVYEQALAGRADARLRIEHCQILDPADIARFAALGVVAAMQPAHATSDMPWAEARLGARRLAGAYAWHTLRERGAVLAFGSDFPVESADPMTGLYAAVTRQDAGGHPPGGWRAEEALSLEEALCAYTVGSAYAAFDEGDAGRIAPGMRADLTVLDRDITQEPSRALLDARVRYTIVRGQVVYERR
jgi:predicted amidohydrolase YtcJ